LTETSGPEKYAPPSKRGALATTEISGPESYAPPRKSTEYTSAEAFSTADRFEEIRAEANRNRKLLDPLFWEREKSSETNDATVENLNLVIQHIVKVSTTEIDAVINLLDDLRDIMRREGEYLSSEIARFMKFKRSAQTAMKAIAGDIKHQHEVPS
jgi:hypothetical protein